MSLKDQMQLDVERVFLNDKEFGKTITYGDLEIIAIVNIDEKTSEGASFGGQGSANLATIEVSTQSVPNVVPKTPVIINGEKWTVRKLLSTDGFMHTIGLISQESQFGRRP